MEDDLDFLPGIVQLLPAQFPQVSVAVLKLILHAALGDGHQLQNGFAQGGFAAAGLPNQAQGLSPVNVQVDVVHGLDVAHRAFHQALFNGEIGFGASNFQKDLFLLLICHLPLPPYS